MGKKLGYVLENGEKKCTRCLIVKSSDEFHRTKSSARRSCD